MSVKSPSSSALDYLFLCSLILFAVMSQCYGQGSIGVCNGRQGSNLPSEQEVVELYKSNGIKRMRIYDPNQATLSALKGSDIELIVDVPREDLESPQADATQWVQTNIIPHFPATKIRYIAVGNEVDRENGQTSRFVPFVFPAMQSIYKALSAVGLQEDIKVSTATYSPVLMDTSPPSKASFKDMSFMGPIINFLAQTRAPLLANIYPYFAYILDTQHIPLPFALFTSPGVVVQDGDYGYTNLFDALVDSMYAAVEKAEGPNVEIIVSESGWPSDGGPGASMENAKTYYKNLIDHVRKGTPRRPGNAIQTNLFAMFDENQKPGDPTEQHFGLFYPNKEQKYPEVTFNNL
ncbi:Glucan endo-1,3-beta-D-glucosidase [Handroanthus impetiginosus]|uniref:Glucan endo-1,3-beta-D-glucosidase n=1 Tax=Handroanthus impetiginosus TaxID=429701 RepID=A0A2G9H794_9LAMI|nr:Glucan endo-1,3-beta-D-glucosidase [Handroanthus impetiginosus]